MGVSREVRRGRSVAGRQSPGAREAAGRPRTLIFNRAAPLVGLDIGSSAVKAVALRRTSRGREVVAVGREPMPRGGIVDGDIADRAVVTEVIRRALDGNRAGTARVATALSGKAVIVKRITLPLMDEDDLAESIRWEAERHIPFDVRDVSLDYHVLRAGRGPADRASMDLLLVAAKKEKIAEYTDAITGAGGVPAVVDVAAFALQNAFEVNYGIDAARVSMLVNAGASGTNVHVVGGGQSLFTRDIPTGGDAYTEALRSELGLSFEEADRLKHGQAVDGAGPDDAAPVLSAVSEHLLLEIDKTLGFFKATTGADRIDELTVSGGSASVPGFLEGLETRFAVPVSLFDPFRRIARGRDERGADRGADSTAAVAVGLALRRGESR